MRIRELSMLGYKSFATRTRLVFPSGLTAVVGPNGSGKSNVADALRWVLGEGRSTALRARSSEEMIFAGTERRPRSGFAEVSLRIDNEDGWLDIDYPEVLVERRAQRDGASHWSINGARVRRMDVDELLGGKLDQSQYTVIGQGVVDRYLSLSPGQRRSLIDEAAGIGLLQRKHAATLRRLADTDENLCRVRDILADLGPRLKRMERLAERARRYEEVSSELAESLAIWYGFQGRRAQEAVRGAARRVEELSAALEAAKAREAQARAALREAERGAEDLDAGLETRRTERDALLAALAAARESAAVARTQREAREARREELAAAIEAAAKESAGLAERAERLEAAAAELGEAAEEAAARRDEAQARLDERERELAEASGALEEARREEIALRAELASARAGLETSSARRAELDEERTELAVERDALAEREAEAARGLERAEAALGAADVAHDALREELRAQEAALREGAAELERRRERHAEARAEREALQARARALEELFRELDAAGDVAEALAAAGGPEVRGTVAAELEVRPDWEAAVAAALGQGAQGLVLADDEAVDRAAALLLAEGRSGVGLLSPRTGGEDAEDEDDATGVARSPARPGLARALLGDVAFVEDLPAAREALRRRPELRRAATRDGLLLERGGLVLVGAGAREVLRLARERRSLPEALAAADEVLEAARVAVDEAADARRALEGRVGELGEARAAAETRRSEAAQERDEARAERERIARERAWGEEALRRLAGELEALSARRETLEASIRQGEAREAALEARVAEARGSVGEVDVSGAREARAEAGARATELAQALAGRRAEARAARRDAEAARERQEAALARRERLEAEIQALAAQAEGAQREEAERAEALAALEGRIAEAAGESRASRGAARERSEALEEARGRAHALEQGLAEARITAVRAEDRLERLGDQYAADLEILRPAEDLPEDEPELQRGTVSERMTEAAPSAGAESEGGGAQDADTPGGADRTAPVSGMADGREAADAAAVPDQPAGSTAPADWRSLPEVEALPADLEARIGQLRRRLRAIGAIDREALATYEDTAAHHGELRAQVEDLQAAERDLREALGQLEAEMDARFERTFTEVAAAFAGFFPRLFGGGEAELRLEAAEPDPESDGEPGPPGIEILARPPGKRRQPLSLLSGGERSLTAVALIFALLRVSGTPFVLLDEVDAALDEANVDRFRTCLRDLADDIQIVIISHNRSTVQAADTIYGVTMAEDGASRTVSLRVSEVA